MHLYAEAEALGSPGAHTHVGFKKIFTFLLDTHVSYNIKLHNTTLWAL